MATFVVNGGFTLITGAFTGANTAPDWLDWGTGAGTTAATDTTLFTETTDESRTGITWSRSTTTLTNDTLTGNGALACVTSGKTITNAGIWTSSTKPAGGTLFMKTDFTGITLAVGDVISFDFVIQFT